MVDGDEHVQVCCHGNCWPWQPENLPLNATNAEEANETLVRCYCQPTISKTDGLTHITRNQKDFYIAINNTIRLV